MKPSGQDTIKPPSARKRKVIVGNICGYLKHTKMQVKQGCLEVKKPAHQMANSVQNTNAVKVIRNINVLNLCKHFKIYIG